MKARDQYAKTMRIDLLFDGVKPSDIAPLNTDLFLYDRIDEDGAKAKINDFDILLHSLYDAAVLVDFNGIIKDANQRALYFFGYERNDLEGKSVVDLISGATADIFNTIIDNADAERFTLLQAYGIRSDNSIFPSEISVTLLPLASESMLCFFIRDITAHRDVDERLRIEGHAIRNAGNGIVISDPQGVISYANPAMCRLWKRQSPEDFYGKCIREYFPSPDLITRAMNTIREGGSWSGEIEAQAFDKERFYVHVSVTSCLDSDETLTHFVYSFADITARRRNEEALLRYRDHLEELIGERTNELRSINKELQVEIAERRNIEAELRQAIKKLREHDASKNLFVSNVSHELRTPLTSLIHSIENLVRGGVGHVPDPVMRYLHRMIEDCWRLERTVNDILDLSRIEAGSFNIHTLRLRLTVW